MKFLAVASLLAAAASALPTTPNLVEVAPRGKTECVKKPRTVSIVIDSSGSNKDNDPNNRRLDAASKINHYLQGGDRIAVTKFGPRADTVYRLGAAGAGADSAISRIEANGGTNVLLGLEDGFNQLAGSHDNAALVIFTDGLDDPARPQDKPKKLAALARAKQQGIRVSWGHLSHSTTKTSHKGGLIGTIWDIIIGGYRGTTEIIPGPTIDADISAAALATGGSVATLSDAAAFDKFVDAVIKNGLTNIDAACNDGNDIDESGGPINNNVTSYGLCSNNAAATFTYKAEKKEKLAVTIALVSKQNKVQLAATLENKATGVKSSVTVNGGNPSQILTGAAEPGQDIVVQINPSGASSDQCQYTVRLDVVPEEIASSLSLSPSPSATPSSSASPQPTPSSSSTQPEVTPSSSSTQPEVTPSSSSTQPEVTPSSSSTQPEVTPSSSSTQPEVTPSSSSTQPEPTPSSSSTQPEPTPSSSVTPEPTTSCAVPEVPTTTVTSTVIQTVTAPAPSATGSVCICKCDAPGAKPMPKFEL